VVPVVTSDSFFLSRFLKSMLPVLESFGTSELELKSAESKEGAEFFKCPFRKTNTTKTNTTTNPRKRELIEEYVESAEYWPPIPIINPESTPLERLLQKREVLNDELVKVKREIYRQKRRKINMLS